VLLVGRSSFGVWSICTDHSIIIGGEWFTLGNTNSSFSGGPNPPLCYREPVSPSVNGGTGHYAAACQTADRG
jgi:hypothetical protein